MDQNNYPEKVNSNLKRFRNSLILSVLFLFVIAAIFSAQTYAYFWDTRVSSSQTIAPGNLDIELLEIEDINSSQTMAASPVKFIPGLNISKTVKVKNTGSLSVYLRVKIEKTVINYENDLPEGWEELITCDFKIDDESTPDIIENLWIYRDGYYYYHGEVAPQSTTASLFDVIHFSPVMGNEFTNSTIELKITCQAIQAANNSGNPLTAWGWPE